MHEKVEQFDGDLFNRAWLFNVGVHLAAEHSDQRFECFSIQDVDNLPLDGVDYSCAADGPIQLSSEIECWNWSVPYEQNSGGEIIFSPAHLLAINGLSNAYKGYGGEDDDLYERLRWSGLLDPASRARKQASGPPRRS